MGFKTKTEATFSLLQISTVSTMEGLQAMLQQHMQQQMEMQKQMMLAMAKLTNASPPEAPKTPVFGTPVLPPPPKRLRGREKSPQRRSPRRKQDDLPRSNQISTFESNKKKEKLKRTLSWSEIFKSGQRTRKSQKAQMLRKQVGLAIVDLDEELLRGDFHDLSDKTKSGLKMNRDRFFDRVAPIVHNLACTVFVEESDDPELPGRCLDMARDIMRKKFQYQAEASEVVKFKQTCGKTNAKRGSLAATKIKKRTKRETNSKKTKRKLIVVPPKEQDAADLDADALDSLFEDEVSYTCVGCGESLPSLTLCYPKTSVKKESGQYHCKRCYDKGNKLINLCQSEIETDKAKKKSNNQKQKKSTKRVNKTKGKTTVYRLHDRVLAQYPGYGSTWFKAEIFGRYRGKFNVYYLDDGTVQKAVAAKDLRSPELSQALLKPKQTKEWAAKSRTDFLNHPFKSKKAGAGTWQATSLGKRNHVNKYVCERVDGNDKTTTPIRLEVHHVRRLLSKKNISS